MTARETMTVHAPRHRQQVRNFALIWMGITLMFGACTFIAIYAATGVVASGNRGLAPVGIVAKPTNTPADLPTVEAIAAQMTATLAAPATNTKPPAGDAPTLVQAQPQQSPQQPQQAQPTAVPPTPAPTATINPIQDKDFDLGIAVQVNPDNSAETYKNWVDMVGNQLRLNWAKSQVVWRDMEHKKGQIDWASTDASIPLLHKANIKVMLSIAKAPDWARDKGAIINKPGQYDGPPANAQDFVDFLNQLLKRYPGMINAIEVWNEVNLDREWATAPQKLDPNRYVALLKAAKDAIKAQDPNIIVITAALSPTGASSGGNYMDDFAYMDLLIAAHMLDNADCVGAHHNGLNVPPDADANNIPERKPRATFHGPWDNPNHSWSFKTTLEGYNKKIKAAGSQLKLCITEFGWPTAEGMTGNLRDGFGFVKDNTAQDQADFIDKAITEMQQWGFVRLAFLFNLNYGILADWKLDGAVGDNVVWSIMGPKWQPRPIWQRIVDRNFRAQARKATP